MVRIEVSDYCQNCPDFQPDVDKIAIESFFGEVELYETVIRCEHAYRCENIVKYLKSKVGG